MRRHADKQHLKRHVPNLPSCKEYSRSKVTSHMPLKAVIFHRNLAQPQKKSARRNGRPGESPCWTGSADAPRRSLQPWSHTLQQRESNSGERTASAPCSLLPLPGQAAVAPPPVSQWCTAMERWAKRTIQLRNPCDLRIARTRSLPLSDNLVLVQSSKSTDKKFYFIFLCKEIQK